MLSCGLAPGRASAVPVGTSRLRQCHCRLEGAVSGRVLTPLSPQFTWCLDACIRERFVDGKRARELQGFLDGVKKGQEQVLG